MARFDSNGFGVGGKKKAAGFREDRR